MPTYEGTIGVATARLDVAPREDGSASVTLTIHATATGECRPHEPVQAYAAFAPGYFFEVQSEGMAFAYTSPAPGKEVEQFWLRRVSTETKE